MPVGVTTSSMLRRPCRSMKSESVRRRQRRARGGCAGWRRRGRRRPAPPACPRRASSMPRLAEIRLLPMPPLPPPTGRSTRRARRGRRPAAPARPRAARRGWTSLRIGRISHRSEHRLAPGGPSPEARRSSRRRRPASGTAATPGRTPAASALRNIGVQRGPRRVAAAAASPPPPACARPSAGCRGRRSRPRSPSVVEPPRGARDHVVEVELGAAGAAAAVLAGVLVARVDVEAGEAHPASSAGARRPASTMTRGTRMRRPTVPIDSSCAAAAERGPALEVEEPELRRRWPAPRPGRAARRRAAPR